MKSQWGVVQFLGELFYVFDQVCAEVQMVRISVEEAVFELFLEHVVEDNSRFKAWAGWLVEF